MTETIGRQLEDVVLGQRLFSDIEVSISFPLLVSQNFPFLNFEDEIFLQVCSWRRGSKCSQASANGSLWHDAGGTNTYMIVYTMLQNLVLDHRQNIQFQAMFSDSFLESSARCVRFPGVTCATFTSLLHFLYTGEAYFVSAAYNLGDFEFSPTWNDQFNNYHLFSMLFW